MHRCTSTHGCAKKRVGSERVWARSAARFGGERRRKWAKHANVYIGLREEARRFGAGLGAVCGALWWRADAKMGETRVNARSFGPALVRSAV